MKAASLHLEGNAAKWHQVFKLQHGMVTWDTFISAVEAKFGPMITELLCLNC